MYQIKGNFPDRYLHIRFSEDLLGGVHIGSLQPDHQGDLQNRPPSIVLKQGQTVHKIRKEAIGK